MEPNRFRPIRSQKTFDQGTKSIANLTLDEALSHLEITESPVTSSQVKSAYRHLMLRWHPDRHTEATAIMAATARARNLNAAYEVLSIYFEANESYVPRESPPPKARADAPRNWASEPTGTRSAGRERRFWNELVEHGFPDDRVFEVFFFSSYLVSGGYNAKERILYQKFHRGGGRTTVYRYFDVPQSIWDGLLSDPSHGRFAVRHINYSFRYEACKEPNRPYNP
jgi:hypothetical protein